MDFSNIKKNYKIYLTSEKDKKKIIDLFIQFEEDCVHHINTESSFVIYDVKKKKYFAACDPIGIKPLYYTVIDSTFYFSKDIGILLQKSKITKEVNYQTMESVVHNSVIAHDATMYKNIKRLPAGHYMYISCEGECTITRYWEPERIKINYKINEQEAQKQFCILFDKAISDRIDNFNTTGFELSGGLDSSSIVSWVKYRKPQEKLKVFSMTFATIKECDESKYIDAMEEKYSLDFQKLATDEMDYKDKYSLENNYKLNPYWPIFITYTMGLSVIEKAEKMDVKTILTGQGGDHIMAGNLFILDEYFRKFNWIRLYRELKVIPKKWQSIKQYLIFPLLGEKKVFFLRSLYQKLKFRKKQNQNTANLPFKEFSDLYKGNSITFKYDLIQILHSTLSVLMQSSYYQLAERKYDIEFRHPFFDKRLIEFMLSLPPNYKYSEGMRKVLLRKAMDGILPEKIRQRTDKAEFSNVLRQQINAIDLDILFDDANLVKLGLIKQKRLDKYKNDYINGTMKQIVYFWQLINLEYWYRYNFVDDHSLDN